jgi:hypothetical protein
MKLLILHPDGRLWVEHRDTDGHVLEKTDEGSWDAPAWWRYREIVIEGGVSVTVSSEMPNAG